MQMMWCHLFDSVIARPYIGVILISYNTVIGKTIEVSYITTI